MLLIIASLHFGQTHALRAVERYGGATFMLEQCLHSRIICLLRQRETLAQLGMLRQGPVFHAVRRVNQTTWNSRMGQ